MFCGYKSSSDVIGCHVCQEAWTEVEHLPSAWADGSTCISPGPGQSRAPRSPKEGGWAAPQPPRGVWATGST